MADFQGIVACAQEAGRTAGQVHSRQSAQQAVMCMSVWCTARQADVRNLCERVIPIQQDVLGLQVHMNYLHAPHLQVDHKD